MRFSHLDLTVRKAGPARPLISHPLRRIDAANSDAGFTLLELVCVLSIVALLVLIALPRSPSATTRTRLEAYAVEIATLLKVDRNAALRYQESTAAVVDAHARTIISGSSARIIRIAEDVKIDTVLPQRCEGKPTLSSITFLANGMSCGGTIRLTRLRSGYDVRVNWLTGNVDIVSQNAL